MLCTELARRMQAVAVPRGGLGSLGLPLLAEMYLRAIFGECSKTLDPGLDPCPTPEAVQR